MRVSLVTDLETITLAGAAGVSDREHGGARDLSVSGEISKQMLRVVRGGHARPIDRGGLTSRVSFSSRRLFGSAAEADAWSAGHGGITREGVLIFDTGAGQRQLLDAVIDPPVCVPDGCSVTAIYRAAGGAIVLIEADILIETGDVEPLMMRMTVDDVAEWFEFGFPAPFLLPGNAADGWTDPGGNLAFRIECSEDLVTWNHDLADAPGSPVNNGDGTYTYWARSDQPRIWKYVTIDLTLASTRHAKAITAVKLFGSTITLPNYPYAMPADAATLQADLVAAGYAGATVSSVPHAMTVEAWNNLNTSRPAFPLTLTGADVTAVGNPSGGTITLPGYPYAMPAEVATLQADIVAAGFPYASVRVYGDEWTIFVPDRSTVFSQRDLTAVFTPPDPYTYQGIIGDGSDAGSSVYGSWSNVRATTGLAPLTEADKQFARMGISAGPNYQY